MKIRQTIILVLIFYWKLQFVKNSNSSIMESEAVPLPVKRIVPIKETNSQAIAITAGHVPHHHLRTLYSIPQRRSKSPDKLTVSKDPTETIVRFTTSLLSEEIGEDSSLEDLLKSILRHHFEGCNLIFLIDKRIKDSVLFEALSQLPKAKQITLMTSQEDLKRVSWMSSGCQGILILTPDPTMLIHIGNELPLEWNYKARVIIAGLTREDLESFVLTKKAKKTEQIIGLVKSDSSGSYEVYMNELYWGQRGMRRIATWQKNTFTTNATLFPDKTSNLHQAVLKVFTFEFEPAIIYHWSKDKQSFKRYGRDYVLVTHLSEALNFSFNVIEPYPGELYGNKLPNGSYTGMVGALASDRVDLAIADIWQIVQRIPYMDFTALIDVDKACLLARIEPPLPLWQSPGLPFQVDAWIATLIGLIFAGPVLHIIAQGNKKRNLEESSNFTLIKSSIYAYGAHFSHPMAFLPSRSSSRIFIAFLWIYSIILTTGYKSNLTAFLTVTREPTSIQTMKELYESGRRLMGLQYFRDQFNASEVSYIRVLARHYDVRLRFDEIKEAVTEGRAVTINSRIYLEFYILKTSTISGKPFYRMMKECLSPHSVIVALQKHSPLKWNFDKMIMRMVEGGLSRKWFLDSIDTYRKLKRQKEDASLVTDVKDGFIALSLEHTQGVFILWSFGAIISTMAFGIEYIYS